ncbi:hypothetical protein ACVBEH_08855 [Roseateles sp. GG27B]
MQQTLDGFVSASDHTPDKLQAQWTEIAKPKGRLVKARADIEALRLLLLQNKLPGAGGGGTSPLAVMLGSQLDKIGLMATADEDWSKAVKAFDAISREITAQLERQTLLGSFLVERNHLAEPVAAEIARAELALKALEAALAQEPIPVTRWRWLEASWTWPEQVWEERSSA